MFHHRFKVAVATMLTVGLVGSGTLWLGYSSPQTKAQDKPGRPVAPERDMAKSGKETVVEQPAINTQQGLLDLLKKKIAFAGAEGRDVKLNEVLDKLTENQHFRYELNEPAFKASNVPEIQNVPVADPTPLPAMKTSLLNVLRKVLSRIPSRSAAIVVVRDDHLEITTNEFFRAELGITPKDAPDEQAAEARDVPLVLVHENFDKEAPETVLKRLATASGFNVVLDPRAASQAKEITAKLVNTPVDTALGVASDMMGLDVVRLDNVFYVTTTEKAARLRQDRASRPWGPAAVRGSARPNQGEAP